MIEVEVVLELTIRGRMNGGVWCELNVEFVVVEVGTLLFATPNIINGSIVLLDEMEKLSDFGTKTGAAAAPLFGKAEGEKVGDKSVE